MNKRVVNIFKGGLSMISFIKDKINKYIQSRKDKKEYIELMKLYYECLEERRNNKQIHLIYLCVDNIIYLNTTTKINTTLLFILYIWLMYSKYL